MALFYKEYSIDQIFNKKYFAILIKIFYILLIKKYSNLMIYIYLYIHRNIKRICELIIKTKLSLYRSKYLRLIDMRYFFRRPNKFANINGAKNINDIINLIKRN